jgi:hypothetical protein
MPNDRPAMMQDQLDAIPAGLRALRQWVCWRLIRRGDGKPTKQPIQPNGQPATHGDPATWSSFEEVCAAAHRYDGIGFVFTEKDPYCGIDLDACFTMDGTLKEWAVETVMAAQEAECYIERTPSGLGLHIIGRAVLGAGRKKDHGQGGVEVYDRLRYFTVTGEQTVSGDVDNSLTPSVSVLMRKYFPPNEQAATVPAGEVIPDHEADQYATRCVQGAAADFLSFWHDKIDVHKHGGDRSVHRLSLLTKLSLKLWAILGRQPTANELRAVALRAPFIKHEMSSMRGKWPRLAKTECPMAIGYASKNRIEAPAVAMPAPMKGLERLDIAGFAEVVPEPRRWIFKGWLPERVTGLMHADGGTGKTRIAMQMHVAKAVGRDLFGMDPDEPGVSVMFSAEEESQSLRLILHEVVRSFSLSRSDVELVEQNLHLIDLTAETAPIMYGPNGWTALGHACLAYAMETSATFVSVDNVTACYAGPATEGAHIYGFVNGWKSAVLPASGSVMLLMHENKAAQTTGNRVHAYSGNAAWHNACRARIELTFDRDDPNAREIARPKSNYSAAMAEPLRLLWTSGAFQREAGSGLVESIRGKADVDAVVQVVRELIASGQNVGASMRANNNARSLAVGRGMAVPPGGRFFKAMDQAIAAGKLRVEEYTNAGRNVVKRIVLGGQDDAL